MKVLKQNHAKWTKEVTCTGKGNGDGGCESLLLIDKNDLYNTYKHYYDGTMDIFTTFKCCLCGVETDVEDVPAQIKEHIHDKKGGN